MKASPACRRVTDTTADSKGLVSRATSACSAPTPAAAATTGSAVRWGMAAWPPRPRTVASNWMAPAMMVPAREATVPDGRVGHTCMPNAALTPSRAPAGGGGRKRGGGGGNFRRGRASSADLGCP